MDQNERDSARRAVSVRQLREVRDGLKLIQLSLEAARQEIRFTVVCLSFCLGVCAALMVVGAAIVWHSP